MKILAGIVRHLITMGGFSNAVQAYNAGDLSDTVVGAVVAIGGIVLSVIDKVNSRARAALVQGEQILGRVEQAVEPLRTVGVEELQAEINRRFVLGEAIKVTPTGNGSDGSKGSHGTGPAPVIVLMAALALACGCATGNRAVPGNQISGSIAGQPFRIENPKNTTLRDVTLIHHSGTNSFELRIGELASTNDPQVIGESYAGQVAVTKAQFDGMAVFADKLLEAAKRGGAAAATGGASELAESGKLKAEMGATPHPTLSPIEAERAQVFELPVGVTPARRDQIAEFLREALRQNTVTNSLGGLR